LQKGEHIKQGGAEIAATLPGKTRRNEKYALDIKAI